MGLRTKAKALARSALRIEFVEAGAYDQDGLRSIHNHEFVDDPAFNAAYGRGVEAAGDYAFHWRVHVALWAAATGAQVPGSFVECGVNRGFLSSAIMRHLDWNSRRETFYLFDTFAGLDERFVSDEEKQSGALAKNTE
jgi:hypothetical protein